MKKRVLFSFLMIVLFCVPSWAQQAAFQPLTFWYEYSVNPGKEGEFLDIVKTVGQPVRDKLMAEGVVLAWGVSATMMRVPGGNSHAIWYAVADWSGIEKVDSAMRAQIAKLTEEAGKSAAGKKGGKAAAGPMDRIREITDMSKTHDFITRDLVVGVAQKIPEGVLPFSRYSFAKVKPGKGGEYRKAWEKYNKPVLEKLLADGVILAYGLSVEEIRTEGGFTHYTWYDTKDLGGIDKVRVAVMADRSRRSQEEQDAIAELFASLTDADAARGEIERSLIFHVPAPK
jgi:hypothetical protein